MTVTTSPEQQPIVERLVRLIGEGNVQENPR